ncbi:unnamed protein product [Meloidogyne enterolobii]|uniref:Uncharacterized protein n=1 Tax=Meloidogyne enterolobii TaxID=390850 RepID=A0ACB1A8X7_MELEN
MEKYISSNMCGANDGKCCQYYIIGFLFSGKADAPITIDDNQGKEVMQQNNRNVQENITMEASITASEIQEVRAFIIEQRKKKEAAEARRKRSLEKSTSTLNSLSSSSKTPTAKKAQIKSQTKKSSGVNRNAFDTVIKTIVEREMSRNATKNKENSKGLDIDSEDIIDELMDYDEEEDESDDPDPNAIISLGEDEEEYKRKRTELPEALLKRAQVLKEPRQGIFIHQCNDCRENQKKRQKFLYNAGSAIYSLLTFELCAEDLDKNINLGVYYAGCWAAGVLYFQCCTNIATGTDYKLLSLLKYCWILHQCDKCISFQRSLANDMFLQKCGEKYELRFIVDFQRIF